MLCTVTHNEIKDLIFGMYGMHGGRDSYGCRNKKWKAESMVIILNNFGKWVEVMWNCKDV